MNAFDLSVDESNVILSKPSQIRFVAPSPKYLSTNAVIFPGVVFRLKKYLRKFIGN